MTGTNINVTVGGVTITISAETAIVTSLELGLGILIALEPLLALPAILIEVLPLLQRNLPLAQMLFDEVMLFFTNRSNANAVFTDVIKEVHQWFAEENAIAANTNPWPDPTNANTDPNANGYPWTISPKSITGKFKFTPDE